MAEGVNNVRVRQKDLARNRSVATSFTFTLDTNPPTVPEVALAEDTGVPGDQVTRNGGLSLSGIEVGATVQYSIDYGLNWSKGFGAVEGLHTVLVRQ